MLYTSVYNKYPQQDIQDTYMVCMALEGWRVTGDRPEVSYGFRKPVFNWVGVEGWTTMNTTNSSFIHAFIHSCVQGWTAVYQTYTEIKLLQEKKKQRNY